MPWELTIINARDRREPLGERDEIIARFASALPGVILQPAARPSPELIAQMPEILRERFKRKPQLTADFEGSDFSIQFYAEDRPRIEAVGAEVRGNGNPVPALAALCEDNEWAVVNVADGALLDLAAEDAPGWSAFRAWRDQALAAIKPAGS
ncbi:MAG TPA: hypothetical protein VFW87_18015 [Pirellulales bacterium]|nr:hypothetical protein [Pirellulales bacterium]